MALKCGIVGLPNVGKSTLFNCLSNTKAQSANFPFCTIEPNVGVITVPDERLTRLVEMCNPRSVVPATVEIVDIAGLVKGASRGEGLGNKFLANIRETDAILHVLRCFDDDNVTHVDGSVDPVRDKEIIDYELQLKDLETIESRISKTQKAAQTGGDKTAKMQYEVLRRYKDALDAGHPARSVKLDTPDEIRYSRELFLLTAKPVLYVCNVDDASAATGNAYVEAVRQAIADEDASLMVVAAQTESEIAELDTYEERKEFLAEIGLEESGVARLIRAAYALLACRHISPPARTKYAPGHSVAAPRPRRQPASYTPISKKDSYAPRSSNTKTTSPSAAKAPCAMPGRWASKARIMSCKTATSCTSALTSKRQRTYI